MMETVIVVLIITVGGLPWVAAPLLIVCFTRDWLSGRSYRPHGAREASAAYLSIGAVLCLIGFNVFIGGVQHRKPPIISATFDEIACWSMYLMSFISASVSLSLFSKAKNRSIIVDCAIVLFGSLIVYLIFFWNFFLTAGVI